MNMETGWPPRLKSLRTKAPGVVTQSHSLTHNVF